MRLRGLLTTAHLVVGMAASPFLLALGLSGAVVAFEDPLDDIVNARLNLTHPGGAPLSIDELQRRVQGARPGARLAAVAFPRDERHSIAVEELGPGPRQDAAFFLDPYTGRVLGTDAEQRPWVGWVHQFHTHLLAGRAGSTVVGWAGVALLFLAVTGLYLWWPGKVVRVRWRGPGRRVALDLHRALGACAWIGLLAFALTGIVIHWEEGAARLIGALTGSGSGAATPPRPAPAAACPDAAGLSPGQLVASAQAAAPGARPRLLVLRDGLARVSLAYPEDRTPGGRTIAMVERCAGRVLSLQSTRGAPPSYTIPRMWNRSVHTGDVLGWPTRVLACLFSLMLPVMALTGPMIWLSRRSSRARPRPRPASVRVAAGPA